MAEASSLLKKQLVPTYDLSSDDTYPVDGRNDVVTTNVDDLNPEGINTQLNLSPNDSNGNIVKDSLISGGIASALADATQGFPVANAVGSAISPVTEPIAESLGAGLKTTLGNIVNPAVSIPVQGVARTAYDLAKDPVLQSQLTQANEPNQENDYAKAYMAAHPTAPPIAPSTASPYQATPEQASIVGQRLGEDTAGYFHNTPGVGVDTVVGGRTGNPVINGAQLLMGALGGGVNAISNTAKDIAAPIGQGLSNLSGGIQNAVSPIMDAKIMGANAQNPYGSTVGDILKNAIGATSLGPGTNILTGGSIYPNGYDPVLQRLQTLASKPVKTATEATELNSLIDYAKTKGVQGKQIFGPYIPEADATSLVTKMGAYKQVQNLDSKIDAAIAAKDPGAIQQIATNILNLGEKANGARPLSPEAAAALNNFSTQIQAIGPPVNGQFTQEQTQRLLDPSTWKSTHNLAAIISDDMATDIKTTRDVYRVPQTALDAGGVTAAMLDASAGKSAGTYNPANAVSQEQQDKAKVAASSIQAVINGASAGQDVTGLYNTALTYLPDGVKNFFGLKPTSGANKVSNADLNNLIKSYYGQLDDQNAESSMDDALANLKQNPGSATAQLAVQQAGQKLADVQKSQGAGQPIAKQNNGSNGNGNKTKTPPNLKHF